MTLVILVVALTALGFLILSVAQYSQAQNTSSDLDNQTALNTTSASSGIEQFTLKSEMKPHSNQFMPEGYFEIKEFSFVPSGGSEICPQNTCSYSVENGEFSSNSYTGGYTFQGKLKVTTQEGEIKKSKFYDFNVDLDKTSEEESNGQILRFLEGTFGFGKDMHNPTISYEITNATLLVDDKNPILTISGERSPF